MAGDGCHFNNLNVEPTDLDFKVIYSYTEFEAKLTQAKYKTLLNRKTWMYI